jgi:hypothetical protein
VLAASVFSWKAKLSSDGSGLRRLVQLDDLHAEGQRVAAQTLSSPSASLSRHWPDHISNDMKELRDEIHPPKGYLACSVGRPRASWQNTPLRVEPTVGIAPLIINEVSPAMTPKSTLGPERAPSVKNRPGADSGRSRPQRKLQHELRSRVPT